MQAVISIRRAALITAWITSASAEGRCKVEARVRPVLGLMGSGLEWEPGW